MYKMKLVAMVAAAGLLAACGDKAESTKPVASAGSSGTNTVKVAEASNAKTGLARCDSSGQTYDTVLDLEKQIQFGDATYQIYRNLYWSKAAKDYSQLAEDFIPAYQAEQDTFKRKDSLKALEPKLDEFYEATKKIKNISVKTNTTLNMYPYSAQEKGFMIGNVVTLPQSYMRKDEAGKYGAFHQVFLNPQLIADETQNYYFKPTEEVARKIEGYLATQRGRTGDFVAVRMQINGYVVSAQTDGLQRLSVIATDSITLLKKNGDVLATLESKDLAPTISIKADTTVNDDVLKKVRAELGIPEHKAPPRNFY